jgi:TRAP-type C4-dicarboxylate transport system permease small subunit
MGVLLSELISVVVYDFLCYFMLTKMLKMRREWIMNVVIPLVSSLIAGLLAFLLNKLFVNLIGDVLTLLICIIFFWAGYMMAMVVSGGFTAHELRKIPLGNLFYGVATAIRRDRYEEE